MVTSVLYLTNEPLIIDKLIIMISLNSQAEHSEQIDQRWNTRESAYATLRFRNSGQAAQSAADCLHRIDRIVQALHRLMGTPLPHTASLNVTLLDAPDETEVNPHSREDEASTSEGTHQEVVVRVTSGAESDTSAVLARAIALHMVTEAYGSAAGHATTFIEGLAGLALHPQGPEAAGREADSAVRAAIEAGSPPVYTPDQGRADSESQTIQPAAISFVWYLFSHFGAQALSKYFENYDPNRQDYAARKAYRRPLAVLHQEWLSQVHRRASDRVMLISFVKQVLPLLAPYRWKQIEILVYLLLAAGFNIVQPYAVKTVIDRLTVEVRSHSTAPAAGPIFMHVLAPFLLLLLGIYVLNGVVSLRRAYTVSWLNQTVLNTLQVRMYAHLQKLAHNFHQNAKVGDLMARLSDDLDTVQSALGQVTNKALYQAFTVVGALTALLMLTRHSPLLSLPILCIVPLFAVTYAALRSRNKQASREQRRGVGAAMADLQQHLSAHAVIKAFGLERRAVADYAARVKSLQRSKIRLAILSALTDLSEDTTTALAQLIIFGVGGYLVLRDGGRGLGVGDLSALLVLVKSIFSPIASLAGIGQTMQQATGAMERVSELFDEPVTVQNKPGAIPLPPLSKEIRIENVTFRYGGSRDALHEVSAVIPAGAHVAIVGTSGGGKSSLVSLLMRFWDPEEGRIVFDGHDIRDVTLESLRSQIGLVFQETFVFDTTLRENIAIGRPDATDEEIRAAARAAQLDKLIESLPAGYDTIPGENGAKLSTGQKQRIAIARTFLRNPRILILDEATSALDAQTEAGVLETLQELAQGRTTISVTHRIGQAVHADLILVIEAGRIVEQGRHVDLVKAGGLYQRLYEEAAGMPSGSRGQHSPSLPSPPQESSAPVLAAR